MSHARYSEAQSVIRVGSLWTPLNFTLAGKVSSVLSNANLADAPAHTVLDAPDSYYIVGFSYRIAAAPYGTLDLVLQKAGVALTLRFEGVHELQIDAGFPHSYMGLEVLDVTHLGWEHSRVRVQGYEEDAPGIRFWAKGVSCVAV